MLLTVLAAAFGAVAGPLLARPVYRLSVEPGDPWRATCPDGHPLPAGARRLLGTGRCARCAAGLGADDRASRYGPRPAVLAAVTAGCCAAVAAAVGPRPELVVWLLLVPGMVLLAAVDRAVHRLPDVVTLPLAGLAVGGLGVAALLPEAGGSWPRALLAAVVLSAGYFVLFLVNPRGMGLGDVKLALAVGGALGWYGWDAVLFGTFVGFLLAAGYGLVLVAARRATRESQVPMGPFMVLGALAALVPAGLAG